MKMQWTGLCIVAFCACSSTGDPGAGDLGADASPSDLAPLIVDAMLDPDAGQALTIPAGQTERLGDPTASYGDPEILSSANKLTFQERDKVWLADLDPTTGRLVSPTGRDLLIDTNAPSMLQTNNGPEFGVSEKGWAVYYARGTTPTQVWRATIEGSLVRREPLSEGPHAHQSQLPSRNEAAESVRILCIEGSWEDGAAVWLDEQRPAETHYVFDIEEKELNSPRWVDGESTIIYSQPDDQGGRQLHLLDTQTGAHRQITNDQGAKAFPYGWLAPEFGDELVVLALVDDRSLAVYRDRGGPYWERVADYPVPEQASGGSMGSPEPFTVKGRSYVSLVITMPGEGLKNQQVWIYDLSEEGTHTMRCDDGALGPVYRIDPETYIGSEQAFVYYYVINPKQGFALHRCATGIRTR